METVSSDSRSQNALAGFILTFVVSELVMAYTDRIATAQRAAH